MTTAIENRIRRQQAGMIATVLLTLTMSGFAQISSSPITANVSAPPRIRRIVLVSIADRRLAVIEDGNVLAHFPVAVGAPVSPSPTGEFEIVNRVADPAYYHDGVVTAASEKSPVGTRWIGLNLKGYGIHGTNAPLSIGQAASHGCIRLKNRDVERLYSMLRVGDVVEIREKRDEEIADIFGGAPDVPVEDVAQMSGQ
jgi:lipoprotein-anchoring transpeptidase ErfK/SrfK